MTNAQTAKQAAKIEVLAMFNENLQGLKDAQKRYSNVMLGNGYIVQVQGVSLSFKCDGMNVSDSKACGAPYNATRFTKDDAMMLAAIVKNGNGESGVAIHINDAISQAIADTERYIAQIDKA